MAADARKDATAGMATGAPSVGENPAAAGPDDAVAGSDPAGDRKQLPAPIPAGRRRAPAEASLPVPAGSAGPAPAVRTGRTMPAAAGRTAGHAERVPPRVASRTAPLSLAAIHASVPGRHEGHDPLRLAIATVLRLASIAWLAGSVAIWARLVGYMDTTIVADWYAPQGPWLTTTTAALLMPVASIGLWLLGPWGVVVWAAATAADGALYWLAPHLMPFGPAALVGNLVALGVLGVLGTVQALRRSVDD